MSIYKIIRNNRLLSNSFIVLVGTIVAGTANYLFQMLMGRMLTVSEFGILESMIALFSFFGIPAAAISVVVTRIVSVFFATHDLSSIHSFLVHLKRFFNLVGIALFLVLLSLLPVVKKFLNLDNSSPYLIFCFSIIIVFTLSIYRGCLNGLQKFKAASINTILESSLKLILAIIFVMLVSWKINGAIFALVSASFVAFGLLQWQLKDLRHYDLKKIPFRPYLKLFIFVFFWMLSLTLIQNLDIVLVKRFFSSEITGFYSALSLLGKIIFFASASVASTLFPMSTELFEKGDHNRHRQLLLRALLLVLIIALPGVIIYMLLPNFVITTLFGTKYLIFSSYLPFFALMSTFLSLIQILSTYFLSIKRKWFLIPLIIAGITEIVLVYLFHSDILQIIKILMAIQFVLIILLFVFFLKNKLPNKFTKLSASDTNSLNQ